MLFWFFVSQHDKSKWFLLRTTPRWFFFSKIWTKKWRYPPLRRYPVLWFVLCPLRKNFKIQLKRRDGLNFSRITTQDFDALFIRWFWCMIFFRLRVWEIFFKKLRLTSPVPLWKCTISLVQILNPQKKLLRKFAKNNSLKETFAMVNVNTTLRAGSSKCCFPDLTSHLFLFSILVYSNYSFFRLY